MAELAAESPGAGGAALDLELDLTRALVEDGSTGGGSQAAARAHATAVTLGLPWLEGLAARTWCECLLAGANTRWARQGVERMAQLGLDAYLGPALSACLAQAEWCRGR